MSENGISIDSRKISSVVDWPIPTTGRQIEQYLGLINYFRDFIPIYSTIAAPLECLRKHTSLPVEKWSQHQLDSFNLLKNILTQAPFLSFPNFREPFIIATDASDAGIGAVLYQLKDPMFTRHCSEPQMDHRALTFIFSQKNLNPMIINWLEILLSYSFSIHHRPGILNILPDTLSRLFPARKDYITNNVLTNHSSAISHHPVPTDFAEPPSDVVPESERQGEIELSHLKGHFGVKATLLDLIKQGKFWPSMRTDIESQLKSCPACRRWTITKVGYHPLTPITSEHPMDVICYGYGKVVPYIPKRQQRSTRCNLCFHQVYFSSTTPRQLRSSSFLCSFSQSLSTLVFLVSSNQTMAQSLLTQSFTT
ncbi:hypothetical protein BASA61_006448 [Batrachochytrium salamandrivorans]|nr:hypothetical protein BASA61_006448 [Batrachochytrium salamandrivorans]